MPAFTTTRRELLNARVYFIPIGELVDGVTVTNAAWPDNTPAANWTAYALQDTETLKSEREFETEEFQIPKAAGGYFKDKETILLSATFVGESARTNSLLKQLEYGLLSQPVVGTAQSPFVRNADFVEGVALIEIQNKTGVVTERIQIWAYLRLTEAGTIGPATKKLTYSLERRDSVNNSYILVA